MRSQPLADEPFHERVDFGFRADVDAARRFVHEQDPRARQQTLRDHDFLLVAPREVVDDRLRARRFDAQVANRVAGCGALLPSIDRRAAHEASQRRQRNIEPHRKRGDQALRFAVLGDERQPASDRVARRADARGTAVEVQRSAHAARGMHAEKRFEHLGSSGALQTGDADDLAGVQREGDVLERTPSARRVQNQLLPKRFCAGSKRFLENVCNAGMRLFALRTTAPEPMIAPFQGMLNNGNRLSQREQRAGPHARAH
jgi:hypothetical protein